MRNNQTNDLTEEHSIQLSILEHKIQEDGEKENGISGVELTGLDTDERCGEYHKCKYFIFPNVINCFFVSPSVDLSLLRNCLMLET